MSISNKQKALMAALVAIVGASAVSASASTGPVEITLTSPAKVTQVMQLANRMGIDYTVRPQFSEQGEFQASVVEMNVQNQVQYAFMRRMAAN